MGPNFPTTRSGTGPVRRARRAATGLGGRCTRLCRHAPRLAASGTRCGCTCWPPHPARSNSCPPWSSSYGRHWPTCPPQPTPTSADGIDRDLSLPRRRARWDRLEPIWDRYLAQAWLGKPDASATPGPGSGLGWNRAIRMLTAATDEVRQLEPADTDGWVHATGQTADLVAVLGRRLEPEPGPLYRAGQHLARAAQLDRHQRRPPAERPASPCWSASPGSWRTPATPSRRQPSPPSSYWHTAWSACSTTSQPSTTHKPRCGGNCSWPPIASPNTPRSHPRRPAP